jgi:hypothetical protein
MLASKARGQWSKLVPASFDSFQQCSPNTTPAPSPFGHQSILPSRPSSNPARSPHGIYGNLSLDFWPSSILVPSPFWLCKRERGAAGGVRVPAQHTTLSLNKFSNHRAANQLDTADKSHVMTVAWDHRPELMGFLSNY